MFFEDEYEIISAADCKFIDASHAYNTKLQINSADSASSIVSFVSVIRTVINSKNFNKEHFIRRRLNLSEAYCLLWQHSGTGDLDKISSSQQLKTGAYAAILLDLHACNKIKIIENNNSLHSYSPNNTSQLVVEVLDTEPTFTFMDRAVFNRILQHHDLSHGRPCSLEEWLQTAEDVCCVTSCLNNLISRGILGRSNNGVFGMFHKHPVLNIGPVEQLERELKAVGLKERRPDSYMVALLTLSLMAENFYSFIDPIVEKHFTKKEYKVAKENLKMIVETQGVVLKSPKFTRKKFSVEVPHQTHTKFRFDDSPLSPIASSPCE